MGPQSAMNGYILDSKFNFLFTICSFWTFSNRFFELTIPSNIITSFDKKSQEGGLLGVFYGVYLVLVLITGPLVGSILVQSASGLQIKPILGMLSFSFAFITVYFACNFSTKATKSSEIR